MSGRATPTDLDREQAAFAAAADRALAVTQQQAAALTRELRAAEADVAAARAETAAARAETDEARRERDAANAEVDAIRRAGHIPAAEGHRLSRLFMRVGRRLKTAGL